MNTTNVIDIADVMNITNVMDITNVMNITIFIGLKDIIIMKEKTLSAVLLAAGNSSRYGGIKLLEEINDVPMYEFMLDNLKKISLAEKVVVTQYRQIELAAKENDFLVVRNDNPQKGISYSIQLGIKEVLKRNNVDGILFSVCDQPFITLETLELLKKAFLEDKFSLICAGKKAEFGNPCIIGKKYFKELMKLDKDTGGKKIFYNHLEDVCVIEVPEIELKDIDTREDIKEITRK